MNSLLDSWVPQEDPVEGTEVYRENLDRGDRSVTPVCLENRDREASLDFQDCPDH